MSDFNLEKVLAGYPTISEGSKVLLVVFDERNGNYPLIAFGVHDTGGSFVRTFTKEGFYHVSSRDPRDLEIDDSRTPLWINLWEENKTGEIKTVVCKTFEKMEEDKKDISPDYTFLKTVSTILED